MTPPLLLFSAFLIGCVCGLRSMTAPAVVAWAAHLGWLHLTGVLALVFTNKITLVVFTLFAVGELIADKLPFVPPRTQIGPLVIRILFGCICGAAVCEAASALGAMLAGVGAVAGTFGGYAYRHRLAPRVPDLVLALIEDMVAVGGGLLIVSHL